MLIIKMLPGSPARSTVIKNARFDLPRALRYYSSILFNQQSYACVAIGDTEQAAEFSKEADDIIREIK